MFPSCSTTKQNAANVLQASEIVPFSHVNGHLTSKQPWLSSFRVGSVTIASGLAASHASNVSNYKPTLSNFNSYPTLDFIVNIRINGIFLMLSSIENCSCVQRHAVNLFLMKDVQLVLILRWHTSFMMEAVILNFLWLYHKSEVDCSQIFSSSSLAS